MKSFKGHLVQENKEKFINKMPMLSDAEKQIVRDFFKKKSNLENQIDWNKWKTLTFDDFKGVMKATKGDKKRSRRFVRDQIKKGSSIDSLDVKMFDNSSNPNNWKI